MVTKAKSKPKQKKKKSGFSSLTKAEKRVELARDALKWLRAKYLTATPGVVVDGGDPYFNRLIEDKGEAQPILQDLLRTGNLDCEVCARGALLLAAIVKEDKFLSKDLIFWAGGCFARDSKVDKRLMAYFSPVQLAFIEGAFEGTLSANAPKSLLGRKLDLILFHERHPNSTERLEEIFKNIIRNGGTFKIQRNAKS